MGRKKSPTTDGVLSAIFGLVILIFSKGESGALLFGFVLLGFGVLKVIINNS